MPVLYSFLVLCFTFSVCSGSTEDGIREAGDAVMRENKPGTGIERHSADDLELSIMAENWRDEVSTRIRSYRHRRSRKHLAGQYSMRLDFTPRLRGGPNMALVEEVAEGPSPPPEAVPIVEVPTELEAEQALPVPSQPYYQAEGWTIPAPLPRLPDTPKIIEFPRGPVFLPPDELAEPVLDAPRILDVPEEIETIALPLADLRLDDAEEDAMPSPRAEFDLPLPVAPLPLRLLSAVADAGIVAMAVGFFAVILWRMCPELPHTRAALVAALAIPVVFWTLYHYLFFAYAGATPGMRAAGIQMKTFTGEFPQRKERRLRALSLLLSCFSLGMGFAWSFVDQDQLCWHDRITRTYLAAR